MVGRLHSEFANLEVEPLWARKITSASEVVIQATFCEAGAALLSVQRAPLKRYLRQTGLTGPGHAERKKLQEARRHARGAGPEGRLPAKRGAVGFSWSCVRFASSIQRKFTPSNTSFSLCALRRRTVLQSLKFSRSPARILTVRSNSLIFVLKNRSIGFESGLSYHLFGGSAGSAAQDAGSPTVWRASSTGRTGTTDWPAVRLC